MAANHPDKYVILMLFRGDLSQDAQHLPLEEVTWVDVRWTRKDCEYADRVDLIDLDGSSRTMKLRPFPEDSNAKVVSLARPDSFTFFNLGKKMPWMTEPYIRIKSHAKETTPH